MRKDAETGAEAAGGVGGRRLRPRCDAIKIRRRTARPGHHPTSSGIARGRPWTLDRRATNGNRADDDETTVGEGHIAVVADADSGGGEESSSVPQPPPIVVIAPPMKDTTTATASSPPAANRSGSVTIPSLLKTRGLSSSRPWTNARRRKKPPPRRTKSRPPSPPLRPPHSQSSPMGGMDRHPHLPRGGDVVSSSSRKR
jgi:hypothetical protein